MVSGRAGSVYSIGLAAVLYMHNPIDNVVSLLCCSYDGRSRTPVDIDYFNSRINIPKSRFDFNCVLAKQYLVNDFYLRLRFKLNKGKAEIVHTRSLPKYSPKRFR